MGKNVIASAGSVILAVGLMTSSANAAVVSGRYQGVIDLDSGLGLIGQTMQVDFSYEDTTADSSGYFDDYLVSMAVTIAGNTWNWDSVNGYSSAFLYNDSVQSFSIGLEDSVSAFNDTFTGPALVVGATGYSFDLYLSDNTPSGAPDGLIDDTVLPGIAPDPSLFNTSDGNTMAFSFFTGNPETGDYYFISTANVTSAATVPLPPAIWLFGSSVLGLGLIKRRRSV